MRHAVIAQGKTAFVDFVVAGILIGAVLVVAGTVVRDRGPRSRPRIARNDRADLAPETLVKAWQRFCVSAGTLITTLGMLIVLVTVVAMVFEVSDRAGTIAVAVAMAISAALLTFAALTMPNHYRRGGFDPVFRMRQVVPASPAAVQDDLEVPLPAGPGQSIDDLFTIDEPFEPKVALISPPAEVQMNVPEISDPAITSIETDRLPDFAAIGRDAPVQESAAEAIQLRPRSPISARRLMDRLRGSRETHLQSTAPVEAGTRFNADDLDPPDELPAWGAPTKSVRRETAPELAPPEPGPRVSRQRETGSGFESSLLADLELVEEAAGGTGPFESRLLNELTSDDSPPGEPRTDMLLDEFSLPERDPQNRDADNSR